MAGLFAASNYPMKASVPMKSYSPNDNCDNWSYNWIIQSGLPRTGRIGGPLVNRIGRRLFLARMCTANGVRSPIKNQLWWSKFLPLTNKLSIDHLAKCVFLTWGSVLAGCPIHQAVDSKSMAILQDDAVFASFSVLTRRDNAELVDSATLKCYEHCC